MLLSLRVFKCAWGRLCAAQSMISEFMQVQTESVMNMNDNGDENGATEARQSTPPHAYCKVNVDALWEGGSKLVGLGVVVWNSNAMCLGGNCNTRLAGLAIKAEAHAALRVEYMWLLKWLYHMWFLNLIQRSWSSLSKAIFRRVDGLSSPSNCNSKSLQWFQFVFLELGAPWCKQSSR